MRLLLTRRFIKSYEKLGKSIQKRVKTSILELEKNPEAGKRLTGDLAGELSLRIGNYRVLYTINGNDIIVETVRHRCDVYRRK